MTRIKEHISVLTMQVLLDKLAIKDLWAPLDLLVLLAHQDKLVQEANLVFLDCQALMDCQERMDNLEKLDQKETKDLKDTLDLLDFLALEE